MKPSVLYLLSHAGLVALGAAAAFHPAVSGLGAAARVAAAFGAGAILLTIEALLYSLLGIPWSIAALALPPLGLAALAGRPRQKRTSLFSPGRAARWVRAVSGVALGFGVLHLLVCLATSRSTSIDYLFFWGVKAVHFAEARAIDVEFLRWPLFAAHGVPEYPPLVSVVQAWGVLFAGEMPWRRAGPLASALWFVAALPLVLALLRRRIGDAPATAVTGFWGTALAVALANSYSGGNAEAPLLFFETVAGLALITESRDEPPSRWLPAVALAGAVLTKVEGSAAVAFLVLGTVLRDRLDRRPAALRRALPLIGVPAVAVGCWFAFQLFSGLPVGYRGHGRLLALHWEHLPGIVVRMIKHLGAGTAGISWIFPALVLLTSARRLRDALPALSMSLGLLVFFAFDYLHDAQDPSERIGWTLPRVSQPALSLFILGAGLAAFGSRAVRRAEATETASPKGFSVPPDGATWRG